METDIKIKLPDDLKIMCRTCMAIPKENETFYDIFENNQETEVHHLIREFTNIKVLLNDDLAKQICNDCYYYLTVFQSFKIQCDNVDKMIRQLVDVSKDETENKIFIVAEMQNDAQQVVDNDCDLKIKEESDIEIYVVEDVPVECQRVKMTKSKNKTVKPKIEENIEDTHRTSLLRRNEGAKIRQCHLCGRTFADYLLLCLHFINHALLLESTRNHDTPLQYILCDQCGEAFEDETQLTAHLSSDHDVKDQYWQCVRCNTFLKSDIDMIKHENDCTEFGIMKEERNIYSCPICLHSFESSNHLELHSLNHLLSKLKCKACEKKFATEAASHFHLEKAHPEYKYKCKYCTNVFSNSRALFGHKSTVHANENSFICSVCGKSFRSFTYLYNHKLIHEEKKHMCSYCGYSTTKSCDLTTHIRTHTSERPYKCNYANCDKYFKTASHRMDHMRRHLQIKKYKCSICLKEFGVSSSLKYHKMTHTGEKPHHCNICNTSFRRAYHLKRHLTRHNKTKK